MPIKKSNPNRPQRVIHINAKCSDLFSATFSVAGKQEGKIYDGYVPDFFPEEHFGDYVELKIDIDTGQILNWKIPSRVELDKCFKP